MPKATKTKKHKVAVALFCADWRLHREKVRVIEKLRRLLGADVVIDVLARPGPDGLLTVPARSKIHAASVKDDFKLLVNAHNASMIAVVAHEDCKGHPVSDAQHAKDTSATVRELKAAIGFKGKAHAIVATRKTDTNWPLKKVATH